MVSVIFRPEPQDFSLETSITSRAVASFRRNGPACSPRIYLQRHEMSSCLSQRLTGYERGQRRGHNNSLSFRSTIMRPMKLSVECYSGRKADERPVRFRLDEKQYQVEAVLDQWYDPEHIFYKVRADDGNLYILRQQTSTPEGTWDLVSFRQTREEH